MLKPKALKRTTSYLLNQREMASDSEMIERMREIVRTADLNTMTTRIVRQRLEEDLGVDLSDRKSFIREHVDIYLQSQFETEDVNVDEGTNDEGVGEVVEAEEEVEESDASKIGQSSTKKRKEGIKKKTGGLTRLCRLSPELQIFTGVPELARTEVVKQLWSYIRENNLQDPSNRRTIICDDTLRNIFGVGTIDMFQMNKALSKHICQLDSNGAAVTPAPKEKQPKQERAKDRDKPKRKEKRQRSGNSGFLAPLKLSDALVKFLGTGESELPRSDVVKRIWDYIKQNNLQDPFDRRQVRCDEKLKALFDVETFQGFFVAKFLAAHFIK